MIDDYEGTFYIDSGASDHLIPSKGNLYAYQKFRNSEISPTNGEKIIFMVQRLCKWHRQQMVWSAKLNCEMYITHPEYMHRSSGCGPVRKCCAGGCWHCVCLRCSAICLVLSAVVDKKYNGQWACSNVQRCWGLTCQNQ